MFQNKKHTQIKLSCFDDMKKRFKATLIERLTNALKIPVFVYKNNLHVVVILGKC